MRVAIVVQNFSRLAGGIAEVVAAHCRELMARGNAVRIFCGYDEFVSVDYGAEFDVRTFVSRGGGFGFLPGLTRAIVEFAPDIVHSHGIWTYSGWGARRAAQILRKPLVISPHGMLDPGALKYSRIKKSIAKFVYEKRNFQYSSAHHALCDAEARAFLAFGLPKAKVRVIPNGVYVPPLSHPPKDGSTFRLLYLGRIHHKKGLDLLLPALSLVPRELLENWDLDIVGWGDAAFIDEMKKLSSSLSLQGKVHFCGPRYGEEKEEMYRKADAFILPSRSEGLPMAVLEAWSHGLPVLMTKECNLPEGFSAAAALPLPLEAEGMARTLTEFFSMSREQRRNLGVNGYDLVRKTFSWQQIGNRLIELYGEISVGA